MKVISDYQKNRRVEKLLNICVVTFLMVILLGLLSLSVR